MYLALVARQTVIQLISISNFRAQEVISHTHTCSLQQAVFSVTTEISFRDIEKSVSLSAPAQLVDSRCFFVLCYATLIGFSFVLVVLIGSLPKISRSPLSFRPLDLHVRNDSGWYCDSHGVCLALSRGTGSDPTRSREWFRAVLKQFLPWNLKTTLH